MALEDYERIDTIPEFAARAGAAAGKSANIELVPIETRFGGKNRRVREVPISGRTRDALIGSGGGNGHRLATRNQGARPRQNRLAGAGAFVGVFGHRGDFQNKTLVSK